MVEFDIFRRDLATWLRCCAEGRRRSSAAGEVSGRNLLIEMLLYRLAGDAENLDPQVFVLFELMLTYRGMALQFLQRREDLLSEVGVTYNPANATDLLRWMIRRTLDDDPRRSLGSDKVPTINLSLLNPDRARLSNGARAAGPAPVAIAAAVDFSTWIGIVAPILSVWELGRALGHVASGARSAVPAAVVSSEPIRSVRHASLTSGTVLQFQPTPTSAMCQTEIRLATAPPPQTGTTIMVVPRSPYCDVPLLASEIGDPAATFELAATLMIGGLVALKVRSWLGARQRRPSLSYRPAWWHSGDALGEA